MFSNYDGSFDSFQSEKYINDSNANFVKNYYKGWKIEGDEFNLTTISENSRTNIAIDSVIDGNGTYTIRYITKEDLIEKYEGVFSIINNDNDAVPMYLNCINEAITVFTQEIEARFKYKSVNNLISLKDAFIYYVLSSIYFNIGKSEDSFNWELSKEFKKKYHAMFELGIKLVEVDVNNDGTIDENEAKNIGASFVTAVW